MNMIAYLLCVCSAVYATLSVLIAIQARERASAILSFCCALTAVWAATGATWGLQHLEGFTGFLDLIRLLTWYSYLLYLYRKSEAASPVQIRGFSCIAWFGLAAGFGMLLTTSNEPMSYTIYSWPISIRLLVCICELLLIENLYLNLPESARWHIALPCVLLAGLACFDILVVADTALFRRPSIPLDGSRVVAMIIVAPLLVLAASRGQRWREPVRLSRAAVFHSATLVLSGSVLLSLAIAGEILRHLDGTWGWVAELSLTFSGLICIMLFLTSRSARSIMDRVVVHHFFADRYDYRSQWLSCIGTLSGQGVDEQNDLHTRAIKAVADVVNSPSGTLFIRDNVSGSMVWANSWNMPSTTNILASHPLIQTLLNTQEVVDVEQTNYGFSESEPIRKLGPTWLAVPLRHAIDIVGIVIVGPPRVAFRIDQEVSDLLGILGQEVGTYIAEQQATEAVFQTRSLHDYGKRFAFVAHDIKNVSSQLGLLLSNAEHHLDNPDFQQDMLETVRASVQKIDRLLKRLDEPSATGALTAISLVPRLEALIVTYQLAGRVTLAFEHDGSDPKAVIGPEAFDTAMSHLINNAIEAASNQSVVVSIKSEGGRVLIEITDQGKGMSSRFIQDDLFVPFKTSRPGGSGIGAFQARELISEAGGELVVISELEIGTTMRVIFTHEKRISALAPPKLLMKTMGDVSG